MLNFVRATSIVSYFENDSSLFRATSVFPLRALRVLYVGTNSLARTKLSKLFS
jgi:hypothetical protein